MHFKAYQKSQTHAIFIYQLPSLISEDRKDKKKWKVFLKLFKDFLKWRERLCLSWVSIVRMKSHDQKETGEERRLFHLPACSLVCRGLGARAQGRNLETRSVSRSRRCHGATLLDSFMSNWYKLENSERGKPQLILEDKKKAFLKLGCT